MKNEGEIDERDGAVAGGRASRSNLSLCSLPAYSVRRPTGFLRPLLQRFSAKPGLCEFIRIAPPRTATSPRLEKYRPLCAFTNYIYLLYLNTTVNIQGINVRVYGQGVTVITVRVININVGVGLVLEFLGSIMVIGVKVSVRAQDIRGDSSGWLAGSPRYTYLFTPAVYTGFCAVRCQTGSDSLSYLQRRN